MPGADQYRQVRLGAGQAECLHQQIGGDRTRLTQVCEQKESTRSKKRTTRRVPDRQNPYQYWWLRSPSHQDGIRGHEPRLRSDAHPADEAPEIDACALVADEQPTILHPQLLVEGRLRRRIDVENPS